MNYVEYVVCKDFRSHQKVGRPSTNNAPVFSERSIKKEISIRVLQAADMKARLIALHLAIEDRYATLEREGDVEGFAMCMKYQDQIYLLVCPDDPLPNPEIRRPLLTALTLAHYVQCAEYSIQTEVYQLRNTATVGESNSNIERSDLHCTYQFISSEQLTFNLNKLNEQLSDRYNMLSLGRDTVGCAIVLQYQDKIKNLLYHSKQ